MGSSSMYRNWMTCILAVMAAKKNTDHQYSSQNKGTMSKRLPDQNESYVDPRSGYRTPSENMSHGNMSVFCPTPPIPVVTCRIVHVEHEAAPGFFRVNRRFLSSIMEVPRRWNNLDWISFPLAMLHWQLAWYRLSRPKCSIFSVEWNYAKQISTFNTLFKVVSITSMQSSGEKPPVKFQMRSRLSIFVPQQEAPHRSANESLAARVLSHRKGKGQMVLCLGKKGAARQTWLFFATQSRGRLWQCCIRNYRHDWRICACLLESITDRQELGYYPYSIAPVLLLFRHRVDEMKAIRVLDDRHNRFVVIDPSSCPCSRLIILWEPLILPIKPWLDKGDNIWPPLVSNWL
jgi:hypothetical protein